ncbi:MAG: 3',5'-cyclic-nucleotide phosphodiesterase [Hydrogenophaga sp.]|nr:3',5'-cyclic-nucleotide phosphodiesterase [Hydrogenophaga sp.]
MRVRVLGCSGAIAQGCRTTAFLLDDDVLIDAGTGVGDLSLEAMLRIDHVLLSHSHLDHVAALPLMIDAVASGRLAAGAPALQVHALPGTIQALRAHLFNDTIWPDFTTIPNAQAPLMRFVPFQIGDVVAIGDKRIEILPAVHTVPAAGFAVAGQTGSAHWVFSGDTGRNPAFWARVNQLDVAHLVIETAFSDRETDLALRSQHLAPSLLAEELACLSPSRRPLIHITHTKPAETALIIEEIHRLDTQPRRDIRWLSAGQVFEV